MAKPRKQKSDDQKTESSGVVLHQKLCISVDMENRRIYGHTEMKVVVPESGEIALHAESMIISNITVDGKDAEFECFPQHQFVDNESSWCSVSCSKAAADLACSSYISSLDRETSPNLIVTCCNKSKEPQNNLVQNGPENIIQNSCAEQVVNGCNEHPEDKDVKIICIDYWLDQPETGIHFGEQILHTDNQIRRVHCWFPCMYTFSQHCLFDLEFTVSSNYVAVSNGDLLYQVLSNDDPPRKTFIYKLNTPVSAGWISLAVAPFEVLPDNHIGIVSHMCLSSDLQKLQNTVGFFHNAFSHYEDYLSTSFPFGSYKQVFIPPELSVSSVNIGASMCLFSSKLLFDEKVIDQTIETRIKLAYALARQWFGVYIIAEEPNDEWLLEGLAGFLSDSFIKGFLGNNEARYRRYKDNCAVCKADTSGATTLCSAAACSNLYGTQTIGVFGRIRSWKAVAVLQMLEKQMGPDSFRKILQVIVERAPDLCRSTRALSTKEFRHLANKVGNLERPFLKEFFPRWIESCGCPVLRMGFSYNKRRNMVELAALRGCTMKIGPVSSYDTCNESQDSGTGWPGMMSIRIHELDGTYDHPILPMAGEACQLLEIQCHSKLAAKRIQKPKKGSKTDGSDDNVDTAPSQDVRTKVVNKFFYSVDSPLLWIRVDPEMEFLADVDFHQPVHMWINQLEKEKDVVAQAQAIESLKNLPKLSFAVINALSNFLSDTKAFWRVRIEAAYALAHTASEESDSAGLVQLIKFYKTRRYDADIGLPRPNDFHDVPEYFVLEAIPHAVSMVRAADNKSPREAVEFVLQLLKYNDNNGNPYSDVYWLITLVRSISELEFCPQSMSLLPSLLKCIDRLMQFDSLMPSYDGILTINCLHTLVRVALKMSSTIPVDHVCELIKPFTSVERSSSKIRIEANKALLDLEYYCKGFDAAICFFTKFMVEEPSLRGQTKLAVHLMQLCQINSESENKNAVSCATLVTLLRLLASRKAFNNVFLRHHLFCILQIIAGRAPTLYGFTKVKINEVAVMKSNGEQPDRSGSLKLKITRTQELLTDTPNHSVDAPSIPEATKEGDTVSNRSEGRMTILKIRVKQPVSSSKADGISQLPAQSRGVPNDTELGHSSSVSVDAPPMKGAIELPCTSNQNIYEVSSSCDHGSRVTASIVYRKSANKDEAEKELQCTANSSNAFGDGLSPSSSRKNEVMFIQRSSGDQNMAISRPDDVPLVTDYVEGKKKRTKEKKDKGSRKKHGDKDGERRCSDDPEYLEHKRLKKERKKMRLARMQEDESRTSATESQNTRKLNKSSGYSSLGDFNKLEESAHVSKPTENAGDTLQGSKGTKIRIKIRNQSIGLS